MGEGSGPDEFGEEVCDDGVCGGSQGTIPICPVGRWVVWVKVVQDVAAEKMGEFLNEAL